MQRGDTIQIYEELIVLQQPVILALGMFDGVHAGHLALLDVQRRQGEALHASRVVYTFQQHPLTVLAPEAVPLQLSTLDEKLALLEQAGVDVVFAVPFTQALAHCTADVFLQSLTSHMPIAHMVLGHDARFGAGGQGDAVFVRTFGTTSGTNLPVTTLPPVQHDNQPVSSSRIRQALQAGECQAAAAMLTREYQVSGTVVRGQQRGRTIGFPTANVESPSEKQLPGDGVYAAWVDMLGQRYAAAVSVGSNPTVLGAQRTIECFILDFDGDLYERTITVCFVRRLRGMVRFASLDVLQAQITRDVADTQVLLGSFR